MLDAPKAHSVCKRGEYRTAGTAFIDMVRYLRTMVISPGSDVERFHAIFLTRNFDYLGDEAMGRSEVASIELRMRDLFAKALAAGSNAMIVAHNHPSGVCRPSVRDIEETRRLVRVGQALDIRLLDHLIITQTAAYSMRAGGDL